MESREVWNSRISEAALSLGFREGYKILYVPWETLGKSDTVFLSLNPGRPPHNAALNTLSDERGNSYEVERTTTASPITAQFLALSELLKLKPKDILTGTVAPFRSDRWKTLSPTQRNGALAIGKEFWRQAFSLKRPKKVIACCPEAARVAVDILGGKPELTIRSGWGDTSLRRYRASDGALIAQIPHLSTFRLLSRGECREPLRTILELS
ncbi:MAG: hypothetical protein V4753_03590 [Pseudomonadota bacterium]